MSDSTHCQKLFYRLNSDSTQQLNVCIRLDSNPTQQLSYCNRLDSNPTHLSQRWVNFPTDFKFHESSTTLPWSQHWLWPLPSKKYIIGRSVMRELRWCLIFGSVAIFGRVMSQKPNPDLWVINLTSEVTGWPLAWDVKFGYLSLRLVTGDMLVFPRSSSLIRGETAREGPHQPPLSRSPRSGRM